jgi:hypothetical protein
MKQVDTLIIAGASITASPWFTWADVVIETLQPKRVINLSARGVGNYYISMSCTNAILNTEFSGNTLCMPMFTCIDKFDMYLDNVQTKSLLNEKHRPLDLRGNPAIDNDFSFWSTGSHWPLVKQQYLDNFFNTDIACVNNIMMFYALEKLCLDKGVDLMPLFDMEIWNYTEKDINEYFNAGTELVRRQLLAQPLTTNIKSLLSDSWVNFTSLIQYAMENNLPVYDTINKLHPPSDVHTQWAMSHVIPALEKEFVCNRPSQRFIEMTKQFSEEWKNKVNY